MPVDMAALAADLAAESAVTRALVAGLDEGGWHTPTPAAGWDIADQISHLAYFDEVAVQSAVRPDEFRADLAAAPENVDPDAIAARYRDRTGAEMLAWFDTARTELLERLHARSHDRLERRVARLVGRVADRDDRRQLDLHGVVAVLGLALAP